MFLMVDRIGFGLWLQKEREDRGWTQSDLARKSGKDRAVINKIENGGAMPAIETTDQIYGRLVHDDVQEIIGSL